MLFWGGFEWHTLYVSVSPRIPESNRFCTLRAAGGCASDGWNGPHVLTRTPVEESDGAGFPLRVRCRFLALYLRILSGLCGSLCGRFFVEFSLFDALAGLLGVVTFCLACALQLSEGFHTGHAEHKITLGVDFEDTSFIIEHFNRAICAPPVYPRLYR